MSNRTPWLCALLVPFVLSGVGCSYSAINGPGGYYLDDGGIEVAWPVDFATAGRSDLPDSATGPTADRTGGDMRATLDLAHAAGAPDLGSCAGKPCDLFCQNCGNGKKCSLDANDDNACIATGTLLPGQACGAKGVDDCEPGAICLGIASNGAGACFKFCRAAADCPGGGACSINVSGTHQNVCTEAVTNCAIVPEAGCQGGTSCFPVNAGGQAGCHVGGGGTTGSTCANDYDCGAGMACFQAPAGCQPLCRKGHDEDCQNGLSCVAVTGWSGSYGVCN